ncbi:unnamed protein product [Medioppia subpectinata]|uniref:C-type lectin domain-containing protein n=1 Tax=Medioppia subpectinata TaxID=1979941 RepID=A0A7R9KGA3_9ACAR|nr:unnamed protein product [Medioppia subpectinata]CAG2103000.1 unnamed protein product [Medioppia subpectinata]
MSHLVNSEGVCGDGWDLFHHKNDNICYKYCPDGLGDYHTVATACKGELNSSLPIINSQAEQEFLNKLIVKYKMIENVWLDATIKGKHIVWTDNSRTNYENWLSGRPVNDSNCVEMLSEQVNMGKWEDMSCAKKNAYLCKRFVAWSSQQMERLIRENSIQIALLQDCPLPVGFIYVQLPGQAEPNTLWPKSTWSDVTATYAGQFFRAEGGGSLAFGAGVQSEDAPRLTDIDNIRQDRNGAGHVTITPGVYTPFLETGDFAVPGNNNLYRFGDDLCEVLLSYLSFEDRFRFGDDLCEVLLSYLSFEDRFRCECVSTQWQRLIFTTQTTLDINTRRYRLYGKRINYVESLEVLMNGLTQMRALIELQIEYYYCDDPLMALMARHLRQLFRNLPKLKKFTLNYDHNYDEIVLSEIHETINDCFTQLKQLEIHGQFARSLFACKQLTHLNLTLMNCKITLETFADYHQYFPKLKCLNLGYVDIPWPVLESLAKHPTLQSVTDMKSATNRLQHYKQNCVKEYSVDDYNSEMKYSFESCYCMEIHKQSSNVRMARITEVMFTIMIIYFNFVTIRTASIRLIGVMRSLIQCPKLKTDQLVNSEGVCGDGWDLFHHDSDDICYKYYPDGLGDYHTVATACKGELNSTLPTINSQSEQEFLNKLIVKYKMIENVWLDATIKGKHIVWTDNSRTDYENWLPGRPVNESNCVELVPDELNMGKWQDIACAKKNAYLCKRFVAWSDQQVERLIRENKRMVDEAVAKIALLQDCPLPVGFIYVQLPSQADPKTLWPKSTWSDVTSAYAGQFFRAEGGGSLNFGAGVQSEDAPRLSHVKRVTAHHEYLVDIDIVPGTFSGYMFTGSYASTDNYLIRSAEVRPRNQAMRIFKRDK